MSSTTFAFALLAGNDLDKVAHTLNTITAQEVGADTSTRVVIAHDNADLTEEWVATVLDGSDVAVTLVPLALKAHPQARRISMLTALAAAIPEDVDWVWTLADDASLYSKFGLEQLIIIAVPAHQDVRFVHGCLAPKSYDTGYTQMAAVRSLCESHGYFDSGRTFVTDHVGRCLSYRLWQAPCRNGGTGARRRYSRHPVHAVPTSI